MLVTLDTSHFEISPLNDVARMNILDMSFALDTSHFEISPLNKVLKENMWLMSITPEVSHCPIDPCGPLEQSPSMSISRHELTAPLRYALRISFFEGCGDFEGCGEDAAVGWGAE